MKYVENLKDGYAICDTTAWLEAGSYQISAYETYSDKKCESSRLLEIAKVPTSETFFVKDNQVTEAKVPIQLSATAEYLKDYIALKAIWEALDGRTGNTTVRLLRWDVTGISTRKLTCGVTSRAYSCWTTAVWLHSSSRASVPEVWCPMLSDSLTELRILNLGAHDELIGGHLFEGVGAFMTPEQRKRIRMDYEQKFLYKDIRENLSQILIDGINANPNFKPIKKSNRIDKKDVQFGNLTNEITGISKALMRCTQLENFFIANSPIKVDNFCENLVDGRNLLTASSLKKKKATGAGTTSRC